MQPRRSPSSSYVGFVTESKSVGGFQSWALNASGLAGVQVQTLWTLFSQLCKGFSRGASDLMKQDTFLTAGTVGGVPAGNG